MVLAYVHVLKLVDNLSLSGRIQVSIDLAVLCLAAMFLAPILSQVQDTVSDGRLMLMHHLLQHVLRRPMKPTEPFLERLGIWVKCTVVISYENLGTLVVGQSQTVCTYPEIGLPGNIAVVSDYQYL